MFNNHKTALSVIVIAVVLVASFSAIVYVQTALAQGNKSAGSAPPGSPQNMSSSAAMNKTASNSTNSTK
jgi:archaellin